VNNLTDGVQTPLQLSDITGSIDLIEGVVFEPNKALLVGVYHDELSAYRARREWLATLGEGFLLESVEDLSLSIRRTDDCLWFILTCEFVSATARYAFWRITRGQAPEEQYRIESAHVASIWERAAMCPDLKQLKNDGQKDQKGHARSKADAALAGLDCSIVLESKTLVERILGTTKGLFAKKPATDIKPTRAQ